MGRLDGMVIWITGASSGIGEAVAKACWQEGANLVLSARRTEELQRVSDGLASSAGREKMILQMDVTDTDSFGNLTEMVIRRFGRIDILVNNAGISQFFRHSGTDEIRSSAYAAKQIGINRSHQQHLRKIRLLPSFRLFRIQACAARVL
jgi:NADP-dependent 3-hydroxy acid dehydrogenase YdfG